MKKRHLFLTIIMVLISVATAVAQAPLRFSYQAVVRNSDGNLINNSIVGVRVSILKDSSSGTAVYSHEYTSRTNANGVFSLVIDENLSGKDSINWAEGPFFLKSEIDPDGGSNYTLTATQQMLSVPYALHAHTVGKIIGGVNFDEKQVLSISNDTLFLTGGSFVVLPVNFSGDYNDLINKPTIPTIPTNISAFINDAGYFTSYTETQALSISNDTLFITGGSLVKIPVGFSGNYNDLTNKPTLFSGNYNDLTNKPTFPTIPTNVSAFVNDAGYITSVTETQVLSISHDTIFLTGGSFVKLPAGFSGNYNDLTNKPSLFSGNYNDLTNKPTIPTIPTNVSAFTNDAGYLTSVNETQTLFAVAANNDSVKSQIKNLYDPTDSMDAVNLRTFHAAIKRYDSIITNMYNTADTLQNPPIPLTITTKIASSIALTTATSGGNITNRGGSFVTSRGVCWGTSSNPTISGSHTSDGNNAGNFTSHITGLTPGTTYYVRAYATNSTGTTYGNEITFTTPSSVPTGALTGIFSVSPTKYVYFSSGNLQYTTTGTHATTDGTATGTWRFADHQYDYIGTANNNISSSYTGWIDLFGWGTSGWNNGNYFYQPYESSKSSSSPYTESKGYGYGPTDGSLYTYSLTGTYANADWGVYNAINNGGNTPGQWRTLSKSEWFYLLKIRNTPSGIRYAFGTVNGTKGLIIAPDNWSTSIYTLNNTNPTTGAYTNNSINVGDWSILENAGCVFLPVAGSRSGTSTTINTTPYEAMYWQTDCSSAGYASRLSFKNGNISIENTSSTRYCGFSVRLVQDL